MSISFAGVPTKQYIGSPYAIAVQLAGQNGRAVPLRFDWTAYGAPGLTNIVVNVELQGGSNQTQLLDRIRSVYIDNLNSNVPVFVQFPDTLYTITAAPNTAGWYPALTNFWKLSVAAISISSPVPKCAIFVSNVYVSSFTDIQIDPEFRLASANLTRSSLITNGDYGIVALGDQSDVFTLPLTGITPINGGVQVFTPLPAPVNFIYLTHSAINIQWVGGFPANYVVLLEPFPNPSGLSILQWRFAAPAGGGQLLFPALNGTNLKLNGALPYYVYQAGGGNDGGVCHGNLVFTTNPL